MTVLEGELKATALPEVLRSIAAGAGSGILTVQGADDIVAVSLLKGGIVSADALNQTVEAGLGEVLQSRGLISAEDFEAVVRDHQSGGGGNLGELLVGRGLLSREELLDGLRQQTYRLMLQILTWREGEYKFYSGDEISYEEGFKPIPVGELLIRSIEDLGEEAGVGGSVPELDAVYRRLPARAPVQVLARDGDGSEDGTWLTEEEAALLAKVDDQASAAALAHAAGLDRYQALYALHSLLREGLIEGTGEAESLSALRIDDRGTPSAPDSLRAEIFTPPEPGELADLELEAEEAAPLAERWALKVNLEPWVGPALAVVLLAAMVLVLLARPAAYLLPFPWQEGQRAAFERQVRQSLFLKIDRAAKTYFLVKAHYPDSLAELEGLGLLAPEDLRDPAGYGLSYATDEVGYNIDLVGGSAPTEVEGLGTTESITGDFLLDPQWLRPGPGAEVPLVLLD